MELAEKHQLGRMPWLSCSFHTIKFDILPLGIAKQHDLRLIHTKIGKLLCPHCTRNQKRIIVQN